MIVSLGIESVLRCLTTAVELKYLTILEDGFNLMTAILQRYDKFCEKLIRHIKKIERSRR